VDNSHGKIPSSVGQFEERELTSSTRADKFAADGKKYINDKALSTLAEASQLQATSSDAAASMKEADQNRDFPSKAAQSQLGEDAFTVEHSRELSKTVNNSLEVPQPETVALVPSSREITSDKSPHLPHHIDSSIRQSTKAEEQQSANSSFQPMTSAVNTDTKKLLSHFEEFLNSTVKEAQMEARPIQKPVKFKDAIGRKFSFPFELCATWAVSNRWSFSKSEAYC
jgi:Ubiquitin-like domain